MVTVVKAKSQLPGGTVVSASDLVLDRVVAADAPKGVVTDPREADVGSILGFGFAPYTGGVLSYIDFMGASPFVSLCRRLQEKHGDRFAPPKILLDMGASGATFYGRAEDRRAA